MRCARPHSTCRRPGFTLLEVTLVMAVLGLVLLLAGLHRPVRGDGLAVDLAARDLAGALQLARSRAIRENRVVAVTLGPAAYSIDGAPPHPLPADLAAAPPALLFAPQGGSSGGVIALRSGARARTVRVDWLTGRVSVAGPP